MLVSVYGIIFWRNKNIQKLFLPGFCANLSSTETK